MISQATPYLFHNQRAPHNNRQILSSCYWCPLNLARAALSYGPWTSLQIISATFTYCSSIFQNRIHAELTKPWYRGCQTHHQCGCICTRYSGTMVEQSLPYLLVESISRLCLHSHSISVSDPETLVVSKDDRPIKETSLTCHPKTWCVCNAPHKWTMKCQPLIWEASRRGIYSSLQTHYSNCIQGCVCTSRTAHLTNCSFSWSYPAQPVSPEESLTCDSFTWLWGPRNRLRKRNL